MSDQEILLAACEILKRKVHTVVQGCRGKKFNEAIAMALVNCGLIVQSVEWLQNLAENMEPEL